MPPKVAQPVVVEVKNITISLIVIKRIVENGSETVISPRGPGKSNIRCRVISSWAENCLTTPIIGGDGFQWTLQEEEKKYLASYEYKFDAEFPTNEDLKNFHQDPGIYFFFQTVQDTTLKPLDLLYIDCSMLLLESTTVSSERLLGTDYEVIVKVNNLKPLKPMPDLLPLEPIVLSMKYLNNFPLYDHEDRKKSLENVYFYSSLQMSGNEFRPFFGFPCNTITSQNKTLENTMQTVPNEISFNNTLSSTMKDEIKDQDKFPLGLNTVLLPGLYDLHHYHDLLKSTTFSVQVHQEDLIARAFSSANIEAYIVLGNEEPGGLGLPGSAPIPAPTNKKGSASGAAVVAGSPFTPIPVKALKSDTHLLTNIKQALEQSKRIRNHGCAKFRLEQLLSKSNDLLLKFALKRDASLTEKDQISIKENLIAAVRLEKPSHPEKWDLPADMSLKKALVAAREKEEQLKLNSSGDTSTVKLFKASKRQPRYELFLSKNTNISIKARLIRKLDNSAHGFDSALPVINAQTLQDPKMTIRPGQDFSKSVRVNQEKLQNLSEEDVLSILSHTPFTRMIIKFPYQDDETLRAINEGINQINHAALPNIQGTIRSYSLEPKEREEAIRGQLDLISGFMILDDDERLVVLEGLAKPNGGIHRFYTEYLPKLNDNTDKYSILINPTILFPNRLYPDYCPDIKRIRIRNKLSILAKRPEIYNHQQVDEICFIAIDLLMNLITLKDMKTSKLLNIYPLMESLNKLELLYGEAISRADMDGTLKKEFLETFKQKRRRQRNVNSRNSSSRPGTSDSRPGTSGSRATASRGSSRGTSRATTPASPDSARSSSPSARGLTGVEAEEESEEEDDKPVYQRREKKVPPTDCRNKRFEEILATRPEHRVDYLEEQRQLRKEAYLNMLYRRQTKQQQYAESMKKTFGVTDEDIAAGRVPNVYTYSTQSENYKSKLMNALREDMKKDPSAIYTMSPDFVSQTICIIDEEKYQKQQMLALANPSAVTNVNKSEWLTQRGFQYPKPKTVKEMYEHPKRPTETRIEDLNEPFLDATDVKKKTMGDSLDHEILVQKEKNFKTQFHLEGVFGGLELPKYEKEFELKYIGHPSTLPRGKLLNEEEKNSGFFKSVFLGGEKQQQLIEQAAEEEKRLWESKVVVENKSFQVGHFVIHDKPLPFARTENILKDPPKKQVLKNLYEKKGFENTPLSVFSLEPYAGKNANNTIGRDVDPNKFITATYPPKEFEFGVKTGHGTSPTRNKTGGTMSQQPQDFLRYLNSNTLKGDLYSKLAKKKHPPIDKSSNSRDFSGPKWEAPSHN